MAKVLAKQLALAVAIGVSFSNLGFLSTAAHAQTVEDLPNLATQQPPAATIPQGDQFSLTLHKRINSQTLRNANGAVDPQAGGQPLPDVEFKIQKLAGNVRNQAEHSHLSDVADAYNKGEDKNLPPLDPNESAQSAKTGTTGEVTFSNLKAGAYLVTETKTPDVAGAEFYFKAKPFIVMVPMTNPDGQTWNSDVHLYPKNSTVRVDASVQDSNKHAEDPIRDKETSEIHYTLDALVPAAPEGKRLVNFKVTDAHRNDEIRLDDDFIESVQRIPAGETEAQAVPLPIGTYTVNKAALISKNSPNFADGANQFVEVSVADPDRAGLKPGDTLQVNFKATLLNAPDQQIENSVSAAGKFEALQDTDLDHDFETPNDKVVTYIGDIRVVKVDADNETTKLEGADFDLFRCDDPDNVIQSGTTNSDGEITFKGIHVNDWENGAAPDNAFAYCLKETEAPSGYAILDDQPRQINLGINTKADNGSGQMIRLASETFKNKSDSQIPTLPSTGGMGILLVALFGLGIIAGGVYAARRNSAKA